MRVRAVGIVASSVLALVGASGPVVASQPARAWLPIIDEPRAGDVLHHQFLAQARSSADRVEFLLEDEEQTRSITVSSPVVDGVAATVIPTWGFSGGVRVKARDCNGSVCGDLKSSPARLTVENDPMGIAQPVGPVDVTVGEQFVPVAISGPGGFLKLTLDGTVVLTGEGAITTPLDLAGRADGVYSLAVQRCSPVAHGVCDPKVALPKIRVLRGLVVRSSDGPVAPFSPNGDGVRDSVARQVTFLPGWAPALDVDATWTLTNDDGAAAATGAIAADAGERGVEYEIDPVQAGFDLDDGRYTLTVDAGAVFDGKLIVGSFTSPHDIVVDTTAPVAAGAKLSATSFDPTGRRGPRSVTGTVKSEPGAQAVVQIVDADGDVVRSAEIACDADGAAAYRWNGTTQHGARAQVGRYRMRWTSTDRAGNTSEPVQSAWVRLVRAS